MNKSNELLNKQKPEQATAGQSADESRGSSGATSTHESQRLIQLTGRSTETSGSNNTKNVYEVLLGGLHMKLKTTHDDKTVNQLIDYVDQKVSEALRATKSGSLQNAAFLACLNLAEELIMLKKRAVGEIERLETKAKKVILELESSQGPSRLDN
ncbi:MAG: cell division protein ZapA [Bdellovibrionales bacterium]